MAGLFFGYIGGDSLFMEELMALVIWLCTCSAPQITEQALYLMHTWRQFKITDCPVVFAQTEGGK